MSKNKTQYIRDKRSPTPLSENVSRVMSANKAKDTSPELAVRKALHGKGIKGYRLHSKKIPGRPDIAFTRKRVAIFINGCFWHRCPICKLPYPETNKVFWKKKFERNKERDKEKRNVLLNNGWKVLVVWEHQIDENLPDILEQIKSLINIK